MLKEGKDYRFDNGKVSFFIDKKWADFNVPNYSIEKPIGVGANGVTFLAFHKLTSRNVVIKVWVPRGGKSAYYRNRFLHEIRKIAKLNHPNVVKIYDANIYDGNICWAVYDLVKGDSLRSWLTKNPSNERRINVAKSIFMTILSFHILKVIHGDLHDRNILIKDDDSICIIDFGTSKFGTEKQSVRREIYFMSRLLHDLLKPISFYNTSHFILHGKYLNKTPNYFVDKRVRRYFKISPRCFSETIVSYIDILEELTYCSCCADFPRLCTSLIKTSYLDIEQMVIFFEELFKGATLFYNIKEVLKENIGADVFPDYNIDNERVKELFSVSLIAYIELANLFKPDIYSWIDSDDNLDIYDDNSRALVLKKNHRARKIIIWYLKNPFSEKPYSLKKLFYKHSDDFLLEHVRELIYNALKRYYNNDIFFDYIIITRIRELLYMS